MRDTDMYGVEGSNQSKNNGDGRYVDAVDMVELLDEGVEVTGDVVDVMLEGGLADADMEDWLDDIPWVGIGAVLAAIVGIAVVIYKLIKRGKKR